MTPPLASDRIGKEDCAYGTGDHWGPGGGGRRTASGPEGSSAKAYSSGAQDHLVIAGLMSIILSQIILVILSQFTANSDYRRSTSR